MTTALFEMPPFKLHVSLAERASGTKLGIASLRSALGYCCPVESGLNFDSGPDKTDNDLMKELPVP